MGIADRLLHNELYELVRSTLDLEEPPIELVYGYPSQVDHFDVFSHLRDEHVDALYLAVKKFQRTLVLHSRTPRAGSSTASPPPAMALKEGASKAAHARETYYGTAIGRIEDAYIKGDLERFSAGIESLVELARFE